MAYIPILPKAHMAPWRGLRVSQWNGLMAALAAAYGAVLLTAPSVAVIAVGIWWNSNTVSHNFIHRPFFQRRFANRLFAVYLSLALGIPQSLWRDRHLAHHAGVRPRWRLRGEALIEAALVLSLWAVLALRAPVFFFFVYAPGYISGLGLCALHGYFEHARGATSHYGRLYNLLCFNDGYHVEHHARPGLHWTLLPEMRGAGATVSAWPAPLRWLDAFSLETLERIALRSTVLQRFVLRTHGRAWRDLIAALPTIDCVGIVGGGLFPRTALILRKLLPSAHITVIDANRENLQRARGMLTDGAAEFVHARYAEDHYRKFDLLVIPLAFDGDRSAIYKQVPAPWVAIHDWIWRPQGISRIVSPLLLKRINLVRR